MPGRVVWLHDRSCWQPICHSGTMLLSPELPVTSDPSPADPDFFDQLREQEARLRAVVDTAVDAVITINERGVVESLNRAAEAMFGYPAAGGVR